MSAKMYYKCPKCSSEDFDCGEIETDDSYAWRIVECNNCGFEWQEIYVFDHNETTDGECNELDDNGNEKE